MNGTIIVRSASTSNGIRMVISGPTGEFPGYINISGERMGFPGTAIASFLLIPSLAGVSVNRLELVDPISDQLLHNIPTIEKILTTWYPDLSHVDLSAPVGDDSKRGDKVGSFFSGGVDSWYTLLTHADEIDSIIFIRGFDIPISQGGRLADAEASCQRAADSLGKNLIVVDTNLREFMELHGRWGEVMHGSALAGVAHLVADLGKVYIPSTYTYTDLFPWGSHPVLDYLWSSEGLQFVHDGAHASRFQKVKRIAESEIALRTLRVCFRRTEGNYNCCRCEKCLRTMLNLEAVGALHRCETFPELLMPENVAAINVKNEGARTYMRDNLQALRSHKPASPFIPAIEKALAPPSIINRIKNRLRRLVA